MFLLAQRHWIDVHLSDGNLLLIGGSQGDVKIFDKRSNSMECIINPGKILKLFNELFVKSDNFFFLGGINCVRWSPSGEMIATAATSTFIRLLDLKTRKPYYTGITSDGSMMAFKY